MLVSDTVFELIVAVAVVDFSVNGCCVFGDLERPFGVLEGIDEFEAEDNVEGLDKAEDVLVPSVDSELNVAVAAFDVLLGGSNVCRVFD